MPDLTNEYSVAAFGAIHRYWIKGAELFYSFSKSDTVLTFNLTRATNPIRARRAFHHHFWSGIACTLGGSMGAFMTYFVEKREVAFEFPQAAVFPSMVIIGLAFVLWHIRGIQAWEIKTGSGDRLTIYQDPRNATGAQAFVTEIRRAQEHARIDSAHG